MKKIITTTWKTVFIIVLLSVLLIGCCFAFAIKHSFVNSVQAYKTFGSGYGQVKTHFEPAKPEAGSVEEAYRDIFMSLLNPYIDKCINEYYGQPFKHDSQDVKILSIDRPDGYRTFTFVLVLEVIPYEGAYRGVGVDRITARVDGKNVKIEKFEHISDFAKLPVGQ